MYCKIKIEKFLEGFSSLEWHPNFICFILLAVWRIHEGILGQHLWTIDIWYHCYLEQNVYFLIGFWSEWFVWFILHALIWNVLCASCNRCLEFTKILLLDSEYSCSLPVAINASANSENELLVSISREGLLIFLNLLWFWTLVLELMLGDCEFINFFFFLLLWEIFWRLWEIMLSIGHLGVARKTCYAWEKSHTIFVRF